MKAIIHKADTRGGGDHGWLSTRYSFSFANWYHPERMGFGVLRVLNDDLIAPSNGFGKHSHRNMEIITIVTSGTVTHADSMGNTFEVPAGDIQVMSAGTGIAHSEENSSKDKPLALFQIWIEPKEQNTEPAYTQKAIGLDNFTPGISTLVAPSSSEGALTIKQDAYISYAVITNNHPLTYTLRDSENGVYIFVVEGELSVVNHELHARDAIGMSEVDSVLLSTKDKATLLLIEVPMQ